MATWKKVLVEGASLQSTTDFTNNTGTLGIGTNGGISLNGAVDDIDNVLLGTATVNLALNIAGLQAAAPEEANDQLAFHDAGTGNPKRAGLSQFAEMFAGTVTATGLDSDGVTILVDITGQDALGTPAGTEEVMVWDGSALKKTTIDAISTAGSGDVESVTAGAGLTGTDEGGPDVTLAVGAGDGITVNANDVALASSVAGLGLTYVSGVLDVGEGAMIDVEANTISVNLTEATAATIAAGDHVIFLDGGAAGTASKGSVNDVATLFAGAGLTATDGVIAVDTVALGTGTSGNYVSNVASGTNISVSGSAAEDATFTVNLADSVDLAGSLDVTGNATFDSDVTIVGNLSVTGEVTSTSTTELLVEDKTILIASGAASAGDANNAGIVVDTSGLDSHSVDAKLNYLESGATFSEWQMIKGEGATPKTSAYVAGMAVGTSQSDLNTNFDCGVGSLGWDGTNLYIQTAS